MAESFFAQQELIEDRPLVSDTSETFYETDQTQQPFAPPDASGESEPEESQAPAASRESTVEPEESQALGASEASRESTVEPEEASGALGSQPDSSGCIDLTGDTDEEGGGPPAQILPPEQAGPQSAGPAGGGWRIRTIRFESDSEKPPGSLRPVEEEIGPRSETPVNPEKPVRQDGACLEDQEASSNETAGLRTPKRRTAQTQAPGRPKRPKRGSLV
jgi:hypothetical protein